jgi:hypothetical protein
MTLRRWALALPSLAFCSTLYAGTSEYEVKAAYVYNFAKFIDWPKTESPDSLAICVYGKDPFGGFLDQTVRGKLAHGLPIVVRRLRAGDESWDGCQVLFFGAGTRIEPALARLQGHSILTVGESDNFAGSGGMIGLVVDQGRVRFDINLAAVGAARLQASSRLIEIGRVVGPRK